MAGKKRPPGLVIDDTAYLEARRIVEVHQDLLRALEALFAAHANGAGTHARGCHVDDARGHVAHALRLLDEELDRERAAGYRPNREG